MLFRSLGIILLSNLACLFALVWLNHKLLEKMTFYRYQADQRKVDFLMVGLFDYLRTNLLGNEKRMVTNVSSALTESFAIEQEIEKRQSFIDYTLLVFSLISFVAFVFVVNFMGYFGKWMNISFWLLLFTWTVTKMKSILIKYYSSKVSFRFINEIFKTKANYFVEESSETKSSLIAEFNNVLVKNVSISFPGKLPVLDNICFSIQKGEITVIYGSTGKGKSLLVSVLSRFLQPNKGEITIDGKNWNNFNDIQWRNSISVVNQPIRFFNATVLGNIGWGVIPFKVEIGRASCRERV